METSQLICSANQLTRFYMMETLVVKRLKYNLIQKLKCSFESMFTRDLKSTETGLK